VFETVTDILFQYYIFVIARFVPSFANSAENPLWHVFK
jgi:hypothetical protein